MKRVLQILAIWLSVCFRAGAAESVSVEVQLEQAQFLPNEELRIAVRITNFSGQTLHLGAEPGWLSFTIESRENALIEKRGEPKVVGEFQLESSMTATKRVDIAPLFNLERPGRYKITAKIKIPQWQQQIFSEPKTFDIVRGTVLKEMEFGVPATEGAGKAPEVRKYILQQASYLNEMMLYVRVTDSTGARTLKLLPLAKMVSFSRPEAQIDRYGNVHVLHQTGQRSFSYCSVNPAGQIMSRQTHDFLERSRPRLQMDDQGRISVKGGTRRFTEADLPPGDNFQSSTNTNAD